MLNYVKETIVPFGLKIDKNVFALIEKISMKYLNYLTDNAFIICNEKKKKTLNVDHIVEVLKKLKMESHINQILSDDMAIQESEELGEKGESKEFHNLLYMDDKEEKEIDDDLPQKCGKKKSSKNDGGNSESFDKQNFREFINKKKKRNKNKKKVEIDDQAQEEQKLLFEKYRAEEMRQELEMHDRSIHSFEEVKSSDNENNENEDYLVGSTKKQKVSHTLKVFEKANKNEEEEIDFD